LEPSWLGGLHGILLVVFAPCQHVPSGRNAYAQPVAALLLVVGSFLTEQKLSLLRPQSQHHADSLLEACFAGEWNEFSY